MININGVWIRRYLTMHSFLRIQSFPPWVRKKHRLRVRSSHRPAFSGERFLAKQTAPDTEIVDVRIRSLSGNIDMRPVTRNKMRITFYQTSPKSKHIITKFNLLFSVLSRIDATNRDGYFPRKSSSRMEREVVLCLSRRTVWKLVV